jgi:hypothetical protein
MCSRKWVEAALVLGFIDGADLDDEAGADAALGLGVFEQGVAQAVVELAPVDGGVDGQITRQVRKIAGEERQGRETERKEQGGAANQQREHHEVAHDSSRARKCKATAAKSESANVERRKSDHDAVECLRHSTFALRPIGGA